MTPNRSACKLPTSTSLCHDTAVPPVLNQSVLWPNAICECVCARLLTPLSIFPVFNGPVLWPYAILNEQQGVACQDPLPAAGHGGAAGQQLGPPQSIHRQWTKDHQPDPPGGSESESVERTGINGLFISSSLFAASSKGGETLDLLIQYS